MKEHFCFVEKSMITYQGECSWCGEREALAQTQEPVCDKDPKSCWFVRCHLGNKCKHTPPQRTWVGLTDEEVRDLWSWSATSEAEKTANTQQHAFAKAIEAKLKEKNT